MIRLILADDHTMFRQGLARLLQSDGELQLLDQAGDGQEAWRLIQLHQPDVALLDISMPALSGMEVARMVMREQLPVRIIMLSMHDDPALASEAESLSVYGYVLKDNTFEELLAAVKLVASGQRFVSPSVAAKLQESMEQSPPVQLSPRERQVLAGIASGLTNKKVARVLTISPKTVDHHRANIMEKLNLHTTADLVRYAVKLGMVS